MTDSLSKDLVSQFSDFIADQTGLSFSRSRRNELRRGMTHAAAELGFPDAEKCVRWLMSAAPLTPGQIECLASHLVVGETYFFREKPSFDAFVEHVIPAVLRAHQGGERRLRIWSAGCSTGEEPYSAAILLSRLLDLREWDVTILGTDINRRALGKASRGVYSEWSFRSTPDWIRQEYFRETQSGQFEIRTEIKEMVTFSHLNLAEDTYPALLNNTAAMDVIFCRNVLMYFSPERAEQITRRFHHALVGGGWLLVSPAEVSHAVSSEFPAVHSSGAILHRKGQSRRHALPATRPTTTPVPDSQIGAPPSQPAHVGPDQTKGPQPEQTPYEDAKAIFEKYRCTEAIEKLLGLLLSNPAEGESGKAMVMLARAYANQGKLDEALTWCQKAVEADQLAPDHHYLGATILQEQGRVEEAADAFRRVMYLDSSFVLAHFSLGNLMLGQGRKSDARKYFENALEILSRYAAAETLAESEGITAGGLAEIIKSVTEGEMVA